MLSLENISYDIGGRFLFRDASLQIKPGDKIGLVGRNGTGKTTLLRLVTSGANGLQGKISMPKSLKIGFLDQNMQSQNTERSVLEVAKDAFKDLLVLRDEISEILAELETSTDEALILKLSNKQQEFELRGGYDMDARAASILSGLGFTEKDQQQALSTFSGGWRMRVILAKILLEQPDLLLLDEPTNHLDLPSIQWLEDYLRKFKGAYVIVSHDRYFLDRLAETIVELSGANFVRYSGNYSFFLKEKVVRSEMQRRQYENQQSFIKETETFISRFRAKASKAKQVQSKVKMLDRLEKIPVPEADEAAINFSFKPDITPGKNILELDLKEKSYGDKEVLKQSRLTIFRGDKIALIGANGIGKSTALRIVAGTEKFQGDSRLGHNVHPAFFAQHQLEALSPGNSIIEEMGKFVLEKGEGFVRNILGGFLFSGDDVDKKIMVLSGGEKSRVALAKTLLSEANFLLLDEPTNHLDIQSIEILVQSLQNYEGTYICVSHDRFFLEKIANKIWYIENKELKEFPGTYAEFEYHLAQREGKTDVAQPAKKQADESENKPDKAERVAAYKEAKRRKQRLNKIGKQIEDAENAVMEQELAKEELMTQMALPENATQFDKLAELQKAFNKIEKLVKEKTNLWESLVEEQEQLLKEEEN